MASDSEIGVFTPEQARMLWQDFQSRQQLQPHVQKNYPQRREIYDVSPHRVFIKNTESETIPAYACVQVTGTEVVGGRTAVTVSKPTTADGEYLFNCQYPIEAESETKTGVGWAYRYGVVVMLGDEPTEAGASYLPIVDSWEIEEGGGPFTVFGLHNADDRGLIGRIGSGGGGGQMMKFQIDSVDCPDGTAIWTVTPLRYTGGCGTIPGADDYGVYTVIPDNCEPVSVSDELVGKTGWAVWSHSVDDCTVFEWCEFVHCPPGGC